VAAIPDPVRVSTTDEFVASLLSEMFPDAVPVLCGLKVRVTGMLWPAARVWGRERPLRLNSTLVEVADEMVTFDPVAVRVAVTLLLAPTATLPKFKAVMLELSVPGVMPLPERTMAKSGAVEATAIVPVMPPSAGGVQRTLKVTLCPWPRLTGRLKPLTPKPGPVTVACETVTVESPVLVNVSNCVRLLPSGMLPKARLDELATSLIWFEFVAEIAVFDVNSSMSKIVEVATRGRKTGSRKTTWADGMAPVLNIPELNRSAR
jgi:hypothetical protein